MPNINITASIDVTHMDKINKRAKNFNSMSEYVKSLILEDIGIKK